MENDNIKLNPNAEAFKIEEQGVYGKKDPLSSGNKFMDIHNQMNKQQQHLPHPYVNPYYADNPNDYYHPENLDEQPPPDYYQTTGSGYIHQPANHPASYNPQRPFMPNEKHPRSNSYLNCLGASSYQYNNCYPQPYYPQGVISQGEIPIDQYNPQQIAQNYYGTGPIPTDPYAQQYYYQAQYISNPPQFVPPPTKFVPPFPFPVNPLDSPLPPPPPPITLTTDEATIISNNDERDDIKEINNEDGENEYLPPIIKYKNIVNSTSSTGSSNSSDNTQDNANSKTNYNNSGNNYYTYARDDKYCNATDETYSNFSSSNASYTNNNNNNNARAKEAKSNNESSGNTTSSSSNDINSSDKRPIEPMTPIREEEDSFFIQVDRINPQTSEKKISDIFSIVGNMKSVKIIENPKRYALVEYSTEKSAIKAIQRFNGTKINGDKILVYWSKEKREKNKIILDNLPYNVEEEKIHNICSILGDIESISIEHPINPNDKSRCAIIFKERESIETAEGILSDGEIDGIPFKLIIDIHDNIKLNISNKAKDDKKPFSAPPLLPSAYQSDLNPSKDKEIIYSAPNPIYKTEKPLIISNFSKEEVEDIFQPYGVKSIKELECLFSFEVVLLQEEMKFTAFKELNGLEYNHKTIILEWGKERREKRQLNTVFVGCLSEEVTEEDLRIEFAKIGELDSVKIFRQKVKGKSPDYAYVNYVDPKCIDKAIKLLNGFKIKGRYITVQYSKKKNARS